MSQGSNEPNASQGHPAYAEILEMLPEQLRPLVQPKLEDWDKRQQAKLQEVHNSLDPYKRFAEQGVSPEILQQSLYLANHLNSNPKDFVERAIQNFNLTDFQQQQVQQQVDELEDEWEGEDITKHPVVKQMMSQLEQMQTNQQKWEQEQQQTQYQKQLEEYLDTLEEKHGEFNRLFVASLLANNVDGDEAVKQYQDAVNSAAVKLTGGNGQQPPADYQQALNVGEDPPTVMGGSGTAGSGSPNQPVEMGKLSAGDTMALVEQMLQQAAKDE